MEIWILHVYDRTNCVSEPLCINLRPNFFFLIPFSFRRSVINASIIIKRQFDEKKKRRFFFVFTVVGRYKNIILSPRDFSYGISDPHFRPITIIYNSSATALVKVSSTLYFLTPFFFLARTSVSAVFIVKSLLRRTIKKQLADYHIVIAISLPCQDRKYVRFKGGNKVL